MIYMLDRPSNIDLVADSRPFQRQATRASIIGIMTAASIVSNYLLIGVFNVKLMDLIVFSSGFLFGTAVGASVGILTWLVYGTLNPYGFSLPILISTSLMESLYGIVGGLLGSNGTRRMGAGFTSNLKYGIVGFLLTFIYDLVTNIVYGLSFGIPPHGRTDHGDSLRDSSRRFQRRLLLPRCPSADLCSQPPYLLW